MENYHEPASHDPSEVVAGRFVGMAVFLLGIGLLILAFVVTYQAFHNPDLIIPRQLLKATTAASTTGLYIVIALKLVLLFAMGYIGSLIAARGAQLFFSARKEARRAATSD